MFDTIERPATQASAVFKLKNCASLDFPCSNEQIEQFQEKGFVIIKNVFTAEEIQMYREELDRVCNDTWALNQSIGRDPAENLRYEISRSGDQPQIWKIDPFIGLSPKLCSITRDRRIKDAVASLYGGSEPVLFKDKIIIKPPQSHGNELHQDYNWWQGFPTSLLSVSIPLDDTNLNNGCTEMYTGHKRGFLHENPGTFSPLKEETIAQEEHHHIEMNAGDMAIFTCFTPHRAGINNSQNNRRVFFLSYNDSRDGEHYTNHYKHFHWYRHSELSEEQKRRSYFL